MAEGSDTNPADTVREQALDAVIAEYISGCEGGSPPDRRQILDLHPELAVELRQFFSQRDRMNQLVSPIRSFAADLFQAVGPGQQIAYMGNYELLEEIARGGMGVVYKARQKTLGRIVAVKMIVSGRLATDDDVQRFQVEAKAAAGLQHPNIVSIHEVGQHEGWHYFSMDYVEGRDLSAILRENLLPAKQAATYVREMAEAIHYAHQQGTLHRDLKPSNILIDSHDQVRITDFGLAMRVEGDNGLTRTGQIVGTPSYMPPEQAEAKRNLIGPGSDVYSLGAILYECLTGRAPFRADSVLKTIEQVIHVEAASPRLLNPGIPRDLETICLKCLEKEPHRRYGTAQLLANDLGRFLRGEPTVARPTTAWERGMKWIRRHPAPTALTLVSVVATLAVVMALVSRIYNARLEAFNVSLKIVNARLETANTRLETTSAELQTTMQAVQVEKTEADRQRARAKEAEAKARRILYAAQMVHVEQARQQKQTERVVQLLRSVIPEDENQEDLRGFEWHHLWRLYHGEQSRLRGHKGVVRSVAFGPDDRLLASAGDDTTIKLWDTTTGKEKFALGGHIDSVTGLSFSPNGTRLVSCGVDKTIKVWDLKARRELFSLEGHTAAVTSVAFSPDDRHIASGSEDKTVRVWDATTGQLFKLKSFANTVSGVAFNIDGKKLACVTYREEKTASSSPVLWEPYTEAEVTPVGISTSPASHSAVSFSPDGEVIATAEYPTPGFGSESRPRVALWKVGEQREPKSVGDHESKITQVVFSPDGQRLASASLDRTVKVWDVESKVVIQTLNDEAGVYAVAFSPDGLRLASGSGDGTVKLWSIAGPGAEARSLKTGPVNNVAFSPDGKRIAGVAGGHIVAWDAFSGREMLKVACTSGYSRAQWSPDGHFLACGAEEIWDAVTGVAHFAHKGHRDNSPLSAESGYLKIAFTADANLLATASGGANKNGVQIVDVANGQVRKTFSIPNWATSVAFSPDNQLLAAGSGYFAQNTLGAVKVWDLDSGISGVGLEQAFFQSVWDVTFSPDGTRLAAAIGNYQKHEPGEVVVWNVQTGVAQHRLCGHSECVWSIAFSPDGKRLASASGYRSGPRVPGEVKLWDLITGQEVCTFPGHTGTVYGVAFSPCGRRLATGGLDGTVKIWDGTPLAETPSRDGLMEGN